MDLDLPSVFVRNIRSAFPADGERWLRELPSLLERAAGRWDLSLGEPFLLSYNYVCAARRRDGPQAVLKIGVPNRELAGEINALRLYAGRGACRLLEADADEGMLLLERLQPGTMLATLTDDDRATGIAADVLRTIRRPAPPPDGFITLRSWFDALQKLRPRFDGGTGPFPEHAVSAVEDLLPGLFAASTGDVLLHGDFHQFNILLSERGWLAIDPKGVIGPAGYEVGPLLMNPWGKIPPEAAAVRRTRRRLDILSGRLDLDRRQLRDWALCHSLLSAWWDLAEDGSGGEYSRAWIEIFLKV